MKEVKKIINPISINGNICKDFKSCDIEEMSVIAGGYIITPRGEVIVVADEEEHRNVFSDYINTYLELEENKIYDTFTATKILCELGCCVYSGVRLEYIKNKLGNLDKSMGSLTFPADIEVISEEQKLICKHLIETNKSLFGTGEKLSVQYGSFPDNVYSKEEIMILLNKALKNTK